MATFLDLVKDVARLSGTVGSDKLPTTLVGLNDRLSKVAIYVDRAWRRIQNHSGQWLWMRSSFSSAAVVQGQREYDPVTHFGLSRFGSWIYFEDGRERRYSIYRTSDGVAHERPIYYVSYDYALSAFFRGQQDENDPQYFTFAPDQKMLLHPIPNGSFTIKGIYQKSAQRLTVDADTPEMPVRFHDLIVNVALDMLEGHDEGRDTIIVRTPETRQMWSDLRSDQLPRIEFAGALA